MLSSTSYQWPHPPAWVCLGTRPAIGLTFEIYPGLMPMFVISQPPKIRLLSCLRWGWVREIGSYLLFWWLLWQSGATRSQAGGVNWVPWFAQPHVCTVSSHKVKNQDVHILELRFWGCSFGDGGGQYSFSSQKLEWLVGRGQELTQSGNLHLLPSLRLQL